MLHAGNDFVTTEPAPTMQPSPNSTPFKIIALAPNQDPLPIITFFDIGIVQS